MHRKETVSQARKGDNLVDRVRRWGSVVPSLLLGAGVAFAGMEAFGSHRHEQDLERLQYGSVIPSHLLAQLRSTGGAGDPPDHREILLYVGSPSCPATRAARRRVDTWAERFPRGNHLWIVVATGFDPSRVLDTGWMPEHSRVLRDPSGTLARELGVLRFPMGFVLSNQGVVEAVLDPLEGLEEIQLSSRKGDSGSWVLSRSFGKLPFDRRRS